MFLISGRGEDSDSQSSAQTVGRPFAVPCTDFAKSLTDYLQLWLGPWTLLSQMSHHFLLFSSAVFLDASKCQSSVRLFDIPALEICCYLWWIKVVVFKKMSVSLTDYVIKPFLDLDDQPVVNGAHSSQKLNSIVSETCLQTIFYFHDTTSK